MNDMVPSGSDANLVISVDNRQALAKINDVIRIFGRMDSVVAAQAHRMSRSFSTMTNWITRAGTALVTYFAGRAVYNALDRMLDRMIEVNRVFTGFIATMNVVKGSTAAARKEYEFLFDVANRLGISLETTTSNYARLAAALKNVDKEGELTRHLFVAISQAAVVLHARGRDVHLIFEAFQQMASKGKLSLEELQRQLGNTLPGAVGLAARAMEMSEAELREGIEKGTINVYEFLAKVANQIKKEYGGSVEYAASQFTARMNVMRNAVFELYRVVGDSGAMDALIRLVNTITEKLSDPSLGENLGKNLGEFIDKITDFIDNFSAADLETGFSALAGTVGSFGIMMDEVNGLVSDFVSGVTGVGDPDVLDSIEFVTNAFLGLVDVLRAILNLLQGVTNAIGATAAFASNSLFGTLDTVMSVTGAIGDRLPEGMDLGRGVRDKYWEFRQPMIDAESRWTQAANDAFDSFMDPLGNGGVMRNRMNFDSLRQARADAAAKRLRERGPLIPMPSYLGGPYQGPPTPLKPGTNYMTPLSPEALADMIEGFPDSTPKPKPRRTGQGMSEEERLAQNFARESIKLIKARSQAENELMNVQANRFENEGRFEQQTRLLLETDADFVKLSHEKQTELLELAKNADAAALALERMVKVQEYNNETLREGYAIQSQIEQLNSSGFVSQYSEEARMQQSFMRGGENEFLDEASRSQMLESARTRDSNNRNLSMAQFAADIRMANEELAFQTDLLGKSAMEVEIMRKTREIDLWVQRESVGATEEQIAKLQEMADVLKGEVSTAIGEVYERQSSMFNGITDGIQRWLDQTNNVAGQFEQITVTAINGLSDAFVDFLETGKLSLDDLGNQIWRMITKLVIELLILKPIMEGLKGGLSGNPSPSEGGGFFNMIGRFLGNLFGGGSFNGNIFSNGNMQAFANGGLVTAPTAFPMANGKFGLMGERGTEAIMPLSRDSSGRLGVKVNGGGARTNVTNITINVPKETDRRTADQIAMKTHEAIVMANRRNG